MNALIQFLNTLPAGTKALIAALLTAGGLGLLDQALGIAAAVRSKQVTFDWKLVGNALHSFWGAQFQGLVLAAGAQFLAGTAFGSIVGGVAGVGFAGLYATFLLQARADIWNKVAMLLGSAGNPLGLTVSAVQGALPAPVQAVLDPAPAPPAGAPPAS